MLRGIKTAFWQREMNCNQNIDFVQDVAKVLGMVAEGLKDKDKYPLFCPNPCPDALSSKPLGDWQNDDELVPSLQLTRNQRKVQALADINGIREQQKIILVLESPHIDEFNLRRCSKRMYCNSLINPLPAPARGRTGENIKHYLPHLFNTPIFNQYKVAIINPIQYQCSLGVSTSSKENRKDELFCRLLTDSQFCYREHFSKRLSETYNPGDDKIDGDLIICCCTDGIGKANNSEIVLGIIHQTLSDLGVQNRFPVLKMRHPCTWNRGCSFRKIWIMKSGQTTISQSDRYFYDKDCQSLYDQFD